MAEILVKAIDAVHSDPIKDERGCYKRGYPVEIRADGTQYGSSETMPTFAIVKIPGQSVASLLSFAQPHERTLTFNILSSDLPNDIFSIQVVAANPTAAGRGNITQAQVQDYLDNWNLPVTASAVNSVTFTADIEQVIQSSGFWGVRPAQLAQIAFTQLNYTQAGGIHRMQADYSGLSVGANIAAATVTGRGGSIVSNSNSVIVFDITRATVQAQFQSDLSSKLRTRFSRRQFFFSSAFMDIVTGVVANWAATTAYVIGDRRKNGGNLYEVITAGTSAGFGGPTGNSQDITDGSVHWKLVTPGMMTVSLATAQAALQDKLVVQ